MTKRIVTLFMVAAMVTALCCNVFAANVCSLIEGDLSKSVTFTVDIGWNLFYTEKVVLEQSKGRMQQQNFYKRTTSQYGKFYVTVQDNSTGKYIYKNKVWNDAKFTIPSYKLKKNNSYDITIKGVPTDGVMNYSTVQWKFLSWTRYPTWTVTKTGGNIQFCY